MAKETAALVRVRVAMTPILFGSLSLLLTADSGDNRGDGAIVADGRVEKAALPTTSVERQTRLQTFVMLVIYWMDWSWKGLGLAEMD